MTMAHAYTNPFIHNIGLNEEDLLPHLLDEIRSEIENETTLIEHSKYYNDVKFHNVLQKTKCKRIYSLKYANDAILKKLLKRDIHITVLLPMLQTLFWIHLIPSAGSESVIFASFTIGHYLFTEIV